MRYAVETVLTFDGRHYRKGDPVTVSYYQTPEENGPLKEVFGVIREIGSSAIRVDDVLIILRRVGRIY